MEMALGGNPGENGVAGAAAVCLSLQNLSAPDRGYCPVELLLDGVQAAKWGRSHPPGWFNSSVGCDLWLTEAGELGDGWAAAGLELRQCRTAGPGNVGST